MVIVTPLHEHFRPDHLQHVIAEMQRRGPPRIRAHFDGEAWFAKEGTHRLRAAKALGVTPILVPIPWWRSAAALERAQYAAIRQSHAFAAVTVSADTR